ncbi:MAG: hypothetical protein ACTHMQ_05420 [Protaetiibacter sp.]
MTLPDAPGDTRSPVTTASEVPAPDGEAERLPRPRIRVGALLWGLVLLAAGGAVLWFASTPRRRADALDALLGLDGFGWTVVIVVALGATITLLALAAVIRRLQHRP